MNAESDAADTCFGSICGPKISFGYCSVHTHLHCKLSFHLPLHLSILHFFLPSFLPYSVFTAATKTRVGSRMRTMRQRSSLRSASWRQPSTLCPSTAGLWSPSQQEQRFVLNLVQLMLLMSVKDQKMKTLLGFLSNTCYSIEY